MKSHKVRYVDHPEFNEPLIFVEIDESGWLPVHEVPSHDAIHRYIDDCNEHGRWHLKFGDKWFDIEPIFKEYKEEYIKGE